MFLLVPCQHSKKFLPQIKEKRHLFILAAIAYSLFLFRFCTYLGCGPDIAKIRKRSRVRYKGNHGNETSNTFLKTQKSC